MKKIIYAILCLMIVFIGFNSYKYHTLKEGDIVFRCGANYFVHYITHSPITHCGIVVKTDSGLNVLEANNKVKLTTLDKFFGFQKYLTPIFTKRVLINPTIDYKQYLGKPYDNKFKLNNDSYYCSELVYVIYKEQFGIELCKPKKVSSYHIFGLGKILKKRHINPNQLVVAPSDLL